MTLTLRNKRKEAYLTDKHARFMPYLCRIQRSLPLINNVIRRPTDDLATSHMALIYQADFWKRGRLELFYVSYVLVSMMG
jgi:hypothetical protein